jgi:prevent-host-death family protein
LSRHLAEVRAGHIVTVTDHGQPIARIVPVNRPTRLKQLLAEGRARPAQQPKQSAPGRLKTHGTVSDLLGEQRR